MTAVLAVIGGTGFAEFAGLENIEATRVATAYGAVTLQRGRLAEAALLFLSRHGTPPSVPPHKINYRANIQALADAGATAVIAVTAVGSVDPSLEVPHLVVPDQIIDYTFGRQQTFFDDEIRHIDFTWPYDRDLRDRLEAACAALCEADPGVPYRAGGVYGCTQGPRLETAAEIHRMAADGCHIVGMTAMPEASLARERGLPYAGLSIVVNKGAGLAGTAIDVADFEPALVRGMGWAREIVYRLACT